MGQLRKRGNRWWMRYYKNGVRLEESARTSDYEKARDLMHSREGSVADGRPVSPKAASLRFDQAAADLEREYTINARRTLKHLKRRLKLHLTPWFGAWRMVDIDTDDVRRFVASRQAEVTHDDGTKTPGASNAEINRELAVLKRMFRLAVNEGRLHARPHIPMLQENNVRRGFFERAQFDAMRAKLPAALRPVVTFAYLTGWRVSSEILPLEWRQVEWDGRVVRLDPGTTKNREGRTFPLTAELEQLLKEQSAEHERLKKARPPRVVACVFHRDGEPIKNFRHAFIAACTAAGCPGRLLHDFRRTAVRNLERDGVSRSAAMAMVGHKTESIYRRYAIVDAGALREAAAKIDQAAAALSGTHKRRMAKASAKGTIVGTIRRTESA